MRYSIVKQVAICASMILVCSLFTTSCLPDFPPLFDPFIDTDDGPVTPDPELKYNEIFRKACHNCYEKQYAESLGEALNYTSNIEIDFWESKDGNAGRKPGQWYVRHDPITLLVTGNDNCCTKGPNNTNDLDACLRNADGWSSAHPDHEVITIFIDKKDGWSTAATGRDPEGIDSLLALIFGDKLYTPADLKAGYASPRDAAAAGAWPSMGDLRGKVIVALTGPNQYLNFYANTRAGEGSVFMVPKIDQASQLSNPPDYSPDNLGHVVFYNMNYAGNGTLAASAVREIGAVGRTWGMPENDPTYQLLIDRDVHIMALYNFREDSFNGGEMEGPF